MAGDISARSGGDRFGAWVKESLHCHGPIASFNQADFQAIEYGVRKRVVVVQKFELESILRSQRKTNAVSN